MCNELKFYGKEHPFSNFYPSEVEIDNITYPTTEHYFQAMKAYNTVDKVSITIAESPYLAKKLGRSCKARKDWNSVKAIFMEKAVRAKFTQNEKLKKFLLKSGDKILIEDSPNDYIWGCGRDDTGQNLLGKILMKIREELRNEK
jgi:hypothetical protein